jgi:hypothetical protein
MPCTATLAQSEELGAAGMPLEAVPALVPSFVALDLAAATGFGDSGQGFLDNFLIDRSWPAVCDAAKALGRVTGYDVYDLLIGDVPSTSRGVRLAVHVFQTEAGAQAFMEWLPTAPPPPALPHWTVDAEPNPPAITERTVTTVPLPGDDAILDHAVTAVSDSQDVLFRRGNVVGQVHLFAPSARPIDVDAAEVSARFAEHLEQQLAEPTTGPDIMAEMSAPLPRSAFGDEYADFTWSDCCAGGRDNYAYVWTSADPVKAQQDVTELGRLGGFAAHYGAQDISGAVVATGFSTYPDDDAASRALDIAKADALAGSSDVFTPATLFEVPGIEGAVGFTRTVKLGPDVGDVPEARVIFVDGPRLASTIIRGDDADPAAVIAAAGQYSERLDSYLP